MKNDKSERPPPERTADEQRMIDRVARSKGREQAEKMAALILAQARSVGELPELGDEKE